MNEKKLFAVLLGGRAEGCQIELHDMVFVISDSLEQAYPRLVTKWFGISNGLHIDSSVELDIIDGHTRNELCVGTLQQHCDDNLVVGGTGTHKSVDDIVSIGCVDGFHIHLTPTVEQETLNVESYYRRLDVPDITDAVAALN